MVYRTGMLKTKPMAEKNNVKDIKKKGNNLQLMNKKTDFCILSSNYASCKKGLEMVIKMFMKLYVSCIYAV